MIKMIDCKHYELTHDRVGYANLNCKLIDNAITPDECLTCRRYEAKDKPSSKPDPDLKIKIKEQDRDCVKANEKEFGSMREITILTPNTFCREIVVVSSVFNFENQGGETAIGSFEGLNFFHLSDKFKEINWDIRKKHISQSDMLSYHKELVSKLSLDDCPQC